MSNDTRRALEDAIITYGVAKALHATSEPNMREIADNALCEAWERIEQLLDTMEPTSV